MSSICPVDPVSPPQDRSEDQTVDDDEVIDVEDAEVKVATRPKGPTRQEREEHECTHIPYRTWCPICVGARGVASPHLTEERTDDERERRRPVIAMDY